MDENPDDLTRAGINKGIDLWLNHWKKLLSITPQLKATQANQVLLDSLIDDLQMCEESGKLPWETIRGNVSDIAVGFRGPEFDEVI
jgi:hypothetical protein